MVVRYQDVSNFYSVHPHSNAITIYEYWDEKYAQKAVGYITMIVPGQSYHLQVITDSNTISVYWNNQYVVSWTDNTSPWLSGKVGFRKYGGSNVRCLPANLYGGGQCFTAMSFAYTGFAFTSYGFMSLEQFLQYFHAL